MLVVVLSAGWTPEDVLSGIEREMSASMTKMVNLGDIVDSDGMRGTVDRLMERRLQVIWCVCDVRMYVCACVYVMSLRE